MFLLIRQISKYIVPIVSFCLLTSCSATSSAISVQLSEPSMTENDITKWNQYYHNQFEYYNGNVASPNHQYPEAARIAYAKELSDWKNSHYSLTFNIVALSVLTVGIILGINYTAKVLRGLQW